MRGVISPESAVTRDIAAERTHTHTHLIWQRVTCPPILVCNLYSTQELEDVIANRDMRVI